MRGVVRTALLLFRFSPVFGGKQAMSDQLDSMFRNSSGSMRSVTTFLGGILHMVDHYGCYCYFDEEYKLGKGEPRSLVDSMCKKLHEGYECAIMDGLAENEPCEPWSVHYTPGQISGLPTLHEACWPINDNNCARRACAVEGLFVKTAFQTFFDFHTNHGLELLHSNGFDPEAECVVERGRQSEYSCCGREPHRKPYKTFEGERGCCGLNVFNTAVYSCCADGTHAAGCD